mgnify:CR=1 FL=1
MQKPKKQEKYKVFTARSLKAMLKMAEEQDGVIITYMEASDYKYPGQLQMTKESRRKIYRYWDD